MVLFLLLSIVVLAFMPALLSYHRKIFHKKLFAIAIITGAIKPLSTIIVPAMFQPEIFEGAMINYLFLALMYYVIIFMFYYVAIIFVPVSRTSNLVYLGKPSILARAFLLIAFLFFSILVLHSHGVFLTNPRLGYQKFRMGVGFVWVFYILAVGVAFYFLAIKRPINAGKVLLFSVLMFLTGSKQLILEVFTKSFLVYVWAGIKIKKWQISLGGILLIVLMLKLFGQFGASTDFLERTAQYFDFIKNASRVFDDYEAGILPQTNGSITLSSFWSYVPRAFYSDKPFAYGPTYLVEMYYPGLAATGHTPSFGMFTPEFVDFRWFAPFVAIFFNLGSILSVIALVIVAANANIAKYWKTGALAFVLVPGFGFHLPILFTAIFAFVVLPNLFHTKQEGHSETQFS